MVPLSVLDLSPIVEGSSAADALGNTLDLARHAERWGYRRYWLAEHHNMPGIASAATSIVIAHVAGGTSTIRVGAGGIMLPNHSPLAIAAQFGPAQMLQAIEVYRGQFEASEQLDRPYVMLGFNVFAADTDDEARLLFTSLQQAFVNLRRGQPGRLPPPRAGFEEQLSPAER